MRLTSPPSRAECHEIWEPKPPRTLWATPGLLQDSFTFYLINHVSRCYCKHLVGICYKCSPVLLQTVSCNVLLVQLQLRTGACHSWPCHKGGVTIVKYVSTMKGMLRLLKEGTSFFDTPGSLSNGWTDLCLPCVGPHFQSPPSLVPGSVSSSSATLTSMSLS